MSKENRINNFIRTLDEEDKDRISLHDGPTIEELDEFTRSYQSLFDKFTVAFSQLSYSNLFLFTPPVIYSQHQKNFEINTFSRKELWDDLKNRIIEERRILNHFRQ